MAKAMAALKMGPKRKPAMRDNSQFISVSELTTTTIPAVLALEVEADRKTWFAKEPAAIDPSDGGQECDLGRGTHRQRVAIETRYPSFTSHGREVPARWQSRANPRSPAAMADFRPEPRPCDRRLRLLHRRDGHLPDSICVRHPGNSDPANDPSQRHG